VTLKKGSSSLVRLTINGKPVRASRGMTILEATRAAGIYVPTLCYAPDLKPYGGCRLCLVEIEGVRGLQTSCTYPVSEGMVVQTETEAVNKTRRFALELLLSSHPSACLVCSRRTEKEGCGPYDICLRSVAVTDRCVTCPANERCELQKVVNYLGLTELRFPRIPKPYPIDSSNPFFELNHNFCILCARCVRACQEITGVGAIDMAYRGSGMKVATFGDKPLMESICKSCGECVAHCPTGALAPKKVEWPAQEVKTTCTYCGVGCQMYLGIKDGKVVNVRGDRVNDVNKGRLCVKGRFGFEFIHHPDRLTTPLLRRNGKLTEAGWDEALDLVASKLGSYKKDEVAVISSARCTNEDNYVMQKFARVVLGTNNVDHCARLCHAPTVGGLAQTFGSGAMTNSINEIGDAICIMMIGSNITEAHPVIGMEVNRAVQKGARLIVVDPREVDFCRHADIWLRLKHGTDVPLLMGLMRIILDEGLHDASFVKERCENFAAFKTALKRFNLNYVSRVTGVPKDKLLAAARLYASTKPATILYTLGITEHSHGTDNVIAVANLAMLTGNIGKPSSGVNPLRGQNNVQGACDMGALPNVYPGYQSVADPASRKKFESAWGCSLPPKPGLTITEIFEAARKKPAVKAMYISGENPALTDPDANHVREVLTNLDFLVVQDIFLTETAQMAHVVLPGASFAEKDGTFTNTERRVQRVRKSVEPVGNSKPDWWITCELGKRMGSKGFNFKHPSEIMEEVASLAPSYGGISFGRLEKGGLQWPCPTRQHPGTPILHTKLFTRGKGRFIPLEYRPPAELPNKKYPLILSTGRCLYHYHASMTNKVEGLNIFRSEELVQINPKDARALRIADGDKIKVTSRRGEVTAKAKITEVTPAGAIWMTFHFAESPTNVLTKAALDPAVKTPEYKVCAVRVEKVKR
jgi:formate dehydrogenase alpha subunit